jgi:hypothetical protein
MVPTTYFLIPLLIGSAIAAAIPASGVGQDLSRAKRDITLEQIYQEMGLSFSSTGYDNSTSKAEPAIQARTPEPKALLQGVQGEPSEAAKEISPPRGELDAITARQAGTPIQPNPACVSRLL